VADGKGGNLSDDEFLTSAKTPLQRWGLLAFVRLFPASGPRPVVAPAPDPSLVAKAVMIVVAFAVLFASYVIGTSLRLFHSPPFWQGLLWIVVLGIPADVLLNWALPKRTSRWTRGMLDIALVACIVGIVH
jgi:hypothetical protein